VQDVLNAHREGTLVEWLQRRRHVARWLGRQLLAPVVGAAGDALRGERAQALAVEWLLRWAITQMRPDRVQGPISREDWLSHTSWRPMLSVMCHFGFEPVPPFRDRYHPQADEAPASHLCGLWSVGPSTYYRYLEKAKRALAAQLRTGLLDAMQRQSLRALVQERSYARLALNEPQARRAWHARQAPLVLAAGDAGSALWHLGQAGDADAFIALLLRCAVELANQPETDGLVETLAAEALLPRQRFELLLAHAALWRMRGRAEREQSAYEQALHIAADAADSLLLGRVYGALGRFHEPRDADRAFAYYQDCTDCLWRAGVGDGADSEAPLVEEFVVALVRLGWSHVLRNDPRSKATLDRAEALRARHALTLPTLAMLEQTLGEYWRRAGDMPRALEHKHLALNLYERASDRASVLKTYSNLSLIYGEAKDAARAIEYSQRVLALADTMAVEPELVASTRLNLGATYFWHGDYALAREQYEIALDLAMKAQLRFVAGRAHYNLAEVAYLQFKQSRDKADEQRGDRHAAAALTVWPHESDPAYVEATKKLKGEILGADADRSADRMAPQEALLYPAELAEVHGQREVLAVPSAPEPHVRAHLRIANAYLAVAMKEREAALSLMQRHGLGDRFASEIGALQTTFERELTLEQQLTRQWAAATGDLLTPARCHAVLARLLDAGAVNKSGYAALCGLSPATASKHLAALAQRGLLMQTGNGPSTRYLLPRAAPAPSG
jgi:tetratricopeptide (TPR) repeat protein